ncbi:Flp pilus assembly complex ATPase component TadA, partial [Candidatus Falkowbacteria bacterium]|nr:Flp pilus assembly complex ATPase component TadA [Candidatus Falkowbacteria bacterium]
LRALLRQDPNIIMVGEIRDGETAELAIHASLTGHFVLSTMHTNSAVGTIPRLLDMKVEAFLLGSTLSTVLAQRLARKICAHCRVEEELPKDLIAEVKQIFETVPKEIIDEELKDVDLTKLTFYRGSGCPRCANSGYSGRVAVVEIINVTDKLRHMIIEQGQALKDDDVRQTQLFVSMLQDGLIKSLKGLTTMQEVLRVMRD